MNAKKFLRKIPARIWAALFCAALWNQFVYYLSQIIAKDFCHINLELAIDNHIPLVPWTISIYFSCYLFWIVNYIICAGQESRRAYQFLIADFIAKALCFACFVLLPTTNTRPVVAGGAFWNNALLFLYKIDAPVNLFPSIHCLVSWLCFVGVRGGRLPLWYKCFSFAAALAVFVSTLTLKQHVVLDVAGGVLVAEIGFWLAGAAVGMFFSNRLSGC